MRNNDFQRAIICRLGQLLVAGSHPRPAQDQLVTQPRQKRVYNALQGPSTGVTVEAKARTANDPAVWT